MSSSFGKIFRLTTWGESHGPALGVVIEGCPAGIPLTVEEIQFQLDRRRVGQSKVTTPRGEKDAAEILSGVFEGVTTGAPISMITYNKDADSSKYENLRECFPARSRRLHLLGEIRSSGSSGRRSFIGAGDMGTGCGRRDRPQDPGALRVRGLSASCARSAGSRWRRSTATRSSRTSCAAPTRWPPRR